MKKSYLEKIEYIDQLSVINTALFKQIFSDVLEMTRVEISRVEPKKLEKNCVIFILNSDK